MKKRPSKPQDVNQAAKSIVDFLAELTEAEEPEETQAEQIARQGGKARAAKLTPAERSAIAKKAAQKRWEGTRE